MKVKIKEVAASRGYTVYRLAKLMEVPQQTLYSWVNGRTQPSYRNMDRLCQTLQCTTGDLFEAEPLEHEQLLFNLGNAI